MSILLVNKIKKTKLVIVIQGKDNSIEQLYKNYSQILKIYLKNHNKLNA